MNFRVPIVLFEGENIIVKARDNGFGYTRIVDALIETKLSCEQVMVDSLLNDVPPTALFDSDTIRDDYDYTPDLIRFSLSNPYVDVVLIGMRTAEHVQQNIELEKGDRLDLDDIHKKFFR